VKKSELSIRTNGMAQKGERREARSEKQAC
jgi:hypothetical protein